MKLLLPTADHGMDDIGGYGGLSGFSSRVKGLGYS